jgi:hypothetical protein
MRVPDGALTSFAMANSRMSAMETPATTLSCSSSAADQAPGMPIFARSGRRSRTRLLMPHFECFDSRDAVAAGRHTTAPCAKVTIDERVSAQDVLSLVWRFEPRRLSLTTPRRPMSILRSALSYKVERDAEFGNLCQVLHPRA